MKHARKDYDRIQDPSGKIPEDEPVFMVRAQDPLFGEVCRFWAMRHKEIGGDESMAMLVRDHSVLGDQWPVKKPHADM